MSLRERQFAAEGTSRTELGRDAFLDRGVLVAQTGARDDDGLARCSSAIADSSPAADVSANPERATTRTPVAAASASAVRTAAAVAPQYTGDAPSDQLRADRVGIGAGSNDYPRRRALEVGHRLRIGGMSTPT